MIREELERRRENQGAGLLQNRPPPLDKELWFACFRKTFDIEKISMRDIFPCILRIHHTFLMLFGADDGWRRFVQGRTGYQRFIRIKHFNLLVHLQPNFIRKSSAQISVFGIITKICLPGSIHRLRNKLFIYYLCKHGYFEIAGKIFVTFHLVILHLLDWCSFAPSTINGRASLIRGGSFRKISVNECR